jgi:hypothetical protein
MPKREKSNFKRANFSKMAGTAGTKIKNPIKSVIY